MPSFVIAEKCDGCKGGEKTACMYFCPNDLMVLDPNEMKAYNQEPDQCWECFSCVKICPTQAIEVRGYADFVPLGSSVMPMLGTEDVSTLSILLSTSSHRIDTRQSSIRKVRFNVGYCRGSDSVTVHMVANSDALQSNRL